MSERRSLARIKRLVLLLVGSLTTCAMPVAARGADLQATRNLLRSGQYAEAITEADQALRDRVFGEDWVLIKAEAEMALGRPGDALQTIETGLIRYTWSIRLRWQGIPIARAAGKPERATVFDTEFADLPQRTAWRYNDADNLVVLGQAALQRGADPRTVLDSFYEKALKLSPAHREAHLAIGTLALDKQDFTLAAETFREAVKRFPRDADFAYGLGRSLLTTDPVEAQTAFVTALEANPRHVPTRLQAIERAIDAEDYDEAERRLEEILALNPIEPRAWAFRAVIAELQHDQQRQQTAEEQAFGEWRENPLIDHLIGRKLSQKYRFAEGAQRQRAALKHDPRFLPARIQLAQDLLRLGDEAAGWKLAEQIHADDGYDVQLFNLLQLKDQLDKYRTLTRGPFVVRMTAREADLFGDAVLSLLIEAQQQLGPKYGWSPAADQHVLVEIFPEPNDFAVRTFGLPGVSGFLGVCFGTVITMNSPSSQADHPANWQSVLWHEYCHVVTLERTRHRLPRWLSEGISVYEERQAQPAWGQRMNPDYRRRILGHRVTPIAALSGAFLSPPSPADLQFAYYQASLVVQFLEERYGHAKLLQVLDDLSIGVGIADALERRTTNLPQLDEEFQEYAREIARRYGADVDWQNYDLSAVRDEEDPERLARWLQDHPRSIQGITLRVQELFDLRDWEGARRQLISLRELFPEQAGAGCWAERLAEVYRQTKDSVRERRTLEEYAPRSDAAIAVYLRLLELEQQDADWPAVVRTAKRLLAVNPLLPQSHRALARAGEELRDSDLEITALRAQLALNPEDPAELHYRLAKRLWTQRDPEARRQVVQALEHAPRYRAAQQLLLEIVESAPQSAPK